MEAEVAGDTVFEGVFSTTTASNCPVALVDDFKDGAADSSGPLLEPPSSKEGQFIGSLLFFNLSSSALSALCLKCKKKR